MGVRYDGLLDKIRQRDTYSASPTGALIWRGMVDTFSELPASASPGDTYTVADQNAQYAWDGSSWVNIAQGAQPSGYTKAEIDAMMATKADVDQVYTKQQIDLKAEQAVQFQTQANKG